jgi:hypothetical protein
MFTGYHVVHGKRHISACAACGLIWFAVQHFSLKSRVTCVARIRQMVSALQRIYGAQTNTETRRNRMHQFQAHHWRNAAVVHQCRALRAIDIQTPKQTKDEAGICF